MVHVWPARSPHPRSVLPLRYPVRPSSESRRVPSTPPPDGEREDPAPPAADAEPPHPPRLLDLVAARWPRFDETIYAFFAGGCVLYAATTFYTSLHAQTHGAWSSHRREG